MTRKLLSSYVTMLLVLGGFNLAWAGTTYFVAMTDSDSDNGTSVGTPFRSGQKCTSVVVAGDTCTFADGTYTDTDGGSLQSAGIVVYANGMAVTPITMRNAANVAFDVTKNYWIFDGSDISGGTATGLNASNTGLSLWEQRITLRTASATSETSAILSWEPSPSPKVVGYRVYIGTTPGVYSWSVNVGRTTTYTFSNLAVGNYYFVVRAYSASGAESGYSNEVSKTITGDSGTQLTARRPSEFP